ncbi:sulfatase-like hydrolase/transferase [Sporosarcina sp. HYO08]|uniref:sulfatase-like hydrolase/transferase n=1 Tax=Sporosarcina sp. HYO08 TaxID=1759557 RepID=UPI00079B5618|nr:sulfatase-like hydrolase/transferase [Sporosarcina sp. HYO08]KXH81910.1 arylsulfatase [Sporosarcina sp. HYO08]
MDKKRNQRYPRRLKRPNILFIIVDQERYPTVYESEELSKWRKENLQAHQWLLKHGMEFQNHYVSSTACAPSRTTLFTGQYPSLHGVSQTPGAAKGSFDADQFWLDPNTVPTMGDYFRAAGYDTYWQGKWHASEADILIPGTHNALPSYDPSTGAPSLAKENHYQKANRLDEYGYSDWIGPDPHGADPRNSGSSAAIGTSGRDEVYSAKTVELIKKLHDQASSEKDHKPWLITCSIVNPHDIALYGIFTAVSSNYRFTVDDTLPYIPPAPTTLDSLLEKPQAQASYRDTYPKMLQPIIDNNFYRQLYFSLMKQADAEVMKVLNALQQSRFHKNTIVVFISDHGELLGAHGGLYQKWYNMYEESIHVPFIISNPILFPQQASTDMLTSHVDVLPTLLGLSEINVHKVQQILSKDHTEVHSFVGRNLKPLVKGYGHFSRINEPIYFMTDDHVSKGLRQANAVTGKAYESVIQPCSIEAVVAMLETGKNGRKEKWKFGRYFDNPQFWTSPGESDAILNKKDCTTQRKEQPVLDEFELYNLTEDPLEQKNLADPMHCTKETIEVQRVLMKILKAERKQKRLQPVSGSVPGAFTGE